RRHTRFSRDWSSDVCSSDLDSVQRQRPWPQQILIGLRLVGQMIFNAFRAREMSESLSQLAFHDALTGLGNRRLLRDRLDQELVQIGRASCRERVDRPGAAAR